MKILVVEGMSELQSLGKDLQLCHIICKNGRRNVVESKSEILDRIITIVALYKRRSSYQVLFFIFYIIIIFIYIFIYIKIKIIFYFFIYFLLFLFILYLFIFIIFLILFFYYIYYSYIY